MRRYYFALLLFHILSSSASAVHVGQTFKEVVKELGAPKGKMGSGQKISLIYDGGVIEMKKGKVSYVPASFEKQTQERIKQREFEAKQRAKGLVKYANQWVTPEEAEKLQQKDELKKAKEAALAQSVKVIRNNGAKIDINSVLVPDKITIIDFFADWCGPCRKLSPELEALARGSTEVYLVKIDIVNWKTPVVKQHNINSVPNVRVYNTKGRLMGSPTSSAYAVKKYVEQALK